MGGSIDVETQIGKGSTFSVTLPACAVLDAADDAGELGQDTSPIKRLPDISGTVLYVEDNPANLKLMEMIVSHVGGLEMHSAHNAELGLELAKKYKPDLILMDINLPGMDGFSAMKTLKSMPQTQDIPVVALSASAMARDVQKGILAGFRFYLTKPLRVDELARVFEAVLVKKTGRPIP